MPAPGVSDYIDLVPGIERGRSFVVSTDGRDDLSYERLLGFVDAMPAMLAPFGIG